MKLVIAFWRILSPSQRRRVLAAQAASLLMALSTMAGIASISPFFAVLADPGLVERSPQLFWLYSHLGLQDRRTFVAVLGIGFAGAILLTNLINLVGSYVLLRIALSIGDDLRAALFAGYLHRNFLFHARANSTALFNNVVYETTRITAGILRSGFLLVTSVATALLIIASMLWVDPVAAAAVVAGLTGGYFLIYLAVRQRIRRSGQIESELAAERTKLVLEGLGAIREIILLRRQAFFQQRFQQGSRALSRVAARIDTISHSPRYLMECVAVCGLVAVALVLGSAEGGIGQRLAGLTFIGLAVYRLLPALQQAFAAAVRLRNTHAAFAAITADLPRAPGRDEGVLSSMVDVMRRPNTETIAMPLDSMVRDWRELDICLSNVNFRYAPHLPPALRDISMRIPAGTVVGLVGANGSGKTTLADVLAGLLVPDSGQLAIDGVALDEANRCAWQSRVAYVPQNVFLLDASIAENIALGIDPGDIDSERMEKALRLARLDELVAALPGGYRECVGERGIRVSGGQRQRLGIARALYRDASVLIMDEATNALDAETEVEVMAAIEALRGSRTIILISHRASTLRHCDLIFELEKGRIARCRGEKIDFAQMQAESNCLVGQR